MHRRSDLRAERQSNVDEALSESLLRKPSALYTQFALTLGGTFLLLHDATLHPKEG